MSILTVLMKESGSRCFTFVFVLNSLTKHTGLYLFYHLTDGIYLHSQSFLVKIQTYENNK